MQIYNIMTCEGFGTEFLGGCSKTWFGLVILFFLIVFGDKWINEFGFDFNKMWSFVFGFAAYVLVATLTGSFKFALLFGIIGMLAGGFLAAQFMGSSSGGGESW